MPYSGKSSGHRRAFLNNAKKFLLAAQRIHRRYCRRAYQLTFAVLNGMLYRLARWPKNLYPSIHVKSSTTLLQSHGKIFQRILRTYYHHISSTASGLVEKEIE